MHLSFAKNGDFIIGGSKSGAPLILRTDSLGEIKWKTWYYDSIKDNKLLSRSVTINSICETSSGQIVCAAGDPYPDINSSPLENYAAYLEFDSLGRNKRSRQWDNQLGSAITPFHIQETNTGNFLMSGYESVFFLDSTGMAKWKASYSFMLDGVGSKTNRISRAKQLRDGSFMVAGQAYEGNCWTRYQKLYYDGWWSPIDSGSGSHASWDTAGWQGGNDNIHDFTQLNDGNLIFVGKRHNVTDSGWLWTFVTDSTGKNKLWEKQTKIKYNTDEGKLLTPLSICAAPDGGFTIAGRTWGSAENGGNNGFIVHFVPVQIQITKIAQDHSISSSKKPLHIQKIGSKIIFYIPNLKSLSGEITIYNAAGKLVTRLSSRTRSGNYVWDYSGMSSGVYFYSVTMGQVALKGKGTVAIQ